MQNLSENSIIIYFIGKFSGNIGSTNLDTQIFDKIKNFIKSFKNIKVDKIKTFKRYKYFDKNLQICLEENFSTYFSENINFVNKSDNFCVGIVDRKEIDNFPIIKEYHNIETYKLETVHYLDTKIMFIQYDYGNKITIETTPIDSDKISKLVDDIIKLFKQELSGNHVQ